MFEFAEQWAGFPCEILVCSYGHSKYLLSTAVKGKRKDLFESTYGSRSIREIGIDVRAIKNMDSFNKFQSN